MENTENVRYKILIIMSVVLATAAVVAVAFNYGKTSGQDTNKGTGKIAIASSRYDFGDISIGGGVVKYNFKISNQGDGDLKLFNISTSCMCTTAILDVNGDRSQPFGMHGNSLAWSKAITPGESANLEVTFDPMAHGPDALGPVTRAITVYSNHDGQEKAKHVFTFTANVVR